MRTITWTEEKLKALIAARDAASAKRQSSFKVELPGERQPAEFNVGYAKYLIEYLEGEFAKNPPRQYPPNREGKEGE